MDRVLAPLAERTPEAEILERYEIPERALRRLTEVGVLSPDGEGYSQAEVRMIDAISGSAPPAGTRRRDSAPGTSRG